MVDTDAGWQQEGGHAVCTCEHKRESKEGREMKDRNEGNGLDTCL